MSKKIVSQEKGLSQAEMSVVSSDFNIAGSDTSASALSVNPSFNRSHKSTMLTYK